MATHDLYRAREMGDRLGIMKEGVLQAVVRSSECGTHGVGETLFRDYAVTFRLSRTVARSAVTHHAGIRTVMGA
jgi:ABC-type multidrug transport system ATPase subunit